MGAFNLTDEEGEYLVRLARHVIESELEIRGKPDTRDAPEIAFRDAGVFDTLKRHNYPGNPLRGCIGIPYPVKPLLEALIETSHNAAFDDPRFPPVKKDELDEIKVEVSVLTPPEKIVVDSPEEYPGRVEVGRDGLIISRGYRRGLLLPQVPADWGWDSEEFLSQTCFKAGLSPDSWLRKETDVYSFRAIIFSEESPRGEVKRHKPK
ncbi:TIGR00296 family protein [Candidatus Bathyarchaeota archaeon]|nr:TIGR00296 family protein [Candidatus Bathyarchaeota archaeon]